MIKKYESMGVINITPDSFSDGAQFNAPETFSKAFKFHSEKFDIVDIGAESTAPKNQAITAEVEIERFNDNFLGV